ncbi:Uncharacterised protein [Corynebacterium pseudotuberculosis]|nr:Uncharacterised protein [Corynebacterium pseudotuberculosis]
MSKIVTFRVSIADLKLLIIDYGFTSIPESLQRLRQSPKKERQNVHRKDPVQMQGMRSIVDSNAIRDAASKTDEGFYNVAFRPHLAL